MNENIDLTKILKDCPKGTKFYSMVAGEVEFVEIGQSYSNILYFNTRNGSFSCFKDGKLYHNEGECILFPSKEQRDWSKFVPNWETNKEVEKVTLHPFDKVLGKVGNTSVWHADFFEQRLEGSTKFISGVEWDEILPYNKDTAHLLGTIDECPIDYEIEFSKEFKE